MLSGSEETIHKLMCVPYEPALPLITETGEAVISQECPDNPFWRKWKIRSGAANHSL